MVSLQSDYIDGRRKEEEGITLYTQSLLRQTMTSLHFILHYHHRLSQSSFGLLVLISRQHESKRSRLQYSFEHPRTKGVITVASSLYASGRYSI